MSGSVTVTGGPAGPPAVSPDTRVSKLAADGSILAVHWNAFACPGAADYQIVYGHASALPSSPGGSFTVAGAECAIGTDAPITWVGVPPATMGPGGFLWWLVLATDGGTREGRWGQDSEGNERAGPMPDGSSGQCGVTAKDAANSCGF
jgi:hypothetical protein